MVACCLLTMVCVIACSYGPIDSWLPRIFIGNADWRWLQYWWVSFVIGDCCKWLIGRTTSTQYIQQHSGQWILLTLQTYYWYHVMKVYHYQSCTVINGLIHCFAEPKYRQEIYSHIGHIDSTSMSSTIQYQYCLLTFVFQSLRGRIKSGNRKWLIIGTSHD